MSFALSALMFLLRTFGSGFWMEQYLLAVEEFFDDFFAAVLVLAFGMTDCVCLFF